MRDVIIIGAGGGGPVVAKELAQRGLDVLVLEAGPHYTDPENQWSRLQNDANNVIDGYFRFGPADRSKPWWLRETPQNSLIWQLAGVGGTTQHYYGNSPRAEPGAFAGYDGADKSNYDVDHRFPFTYQELIPYYEWVEETLPVQTAAMGTKEEIWLRGAEKLGLHHQTGKDIHQPSYRPQENAILQPGGTAGKTTDAARLKFPEATGCTFCGYCFEGCFEPQQAPRNLKAKRSTDNSYVPMAMTADKWIAGGKAITLIPDAFATRINTAMEGGATVAKSVTWRVGATGERHTEEAKVIVMAGGCTEDPRLWLNSDLPNPNDWVGRGYTDHFFDWVIGVFPFDTGNSKGVGSSARVDYPGYGGLENVGLPPAIQAFSMAFSDAGIRGQYGNGLARTGPWDGDSGRMLGAEMAEALSDVNRLVNTLVITDDDVEAQNRVSLSAVFTQDEHGPVPKVTFNHRARTARTLRNREFLAHRAAELLRAAGATKVVRIDWPPLVLHVQSTMRMGENEADSVLDSNAESRAVKRLFVGDNAALSNALGGPNPTLTSQAVATRTAEKIFQLYFDGDPWVGGEAPISSIDDRVTSAVLGRPFGGPPPRLL
ncbi:MAG: GMC oxidoreductase, partial [Actinomycetota bacterium]|nr:GMC oxidoreductase [Actinomycetota bacterium]